MYPQFDKVGTSVEEVDKVNVNYTLIYMRVVNIDVYIVSATDFVDTVCDVENVT